MQSYACMSILVRPAVYLYNLCTWHGRCLHGMPKGMKSDIACTQVQAICPDTTAQHTHLPKIVQYYDFLWAPVGSRQDCTITINIQFNNYQRLLFPLPLQSYIDGKSGLLINTLHYDHTNTHLHSSCSAQVPTGPVAIGLLKHAVQRNTLNVL